MSRTGRRARPNLASPRRPISEGACGRRRYFSGSAQSFLARELSPDVERSGAQIEISSRRGAFPFQRIERTTAPHPVDVEAQEMIEQIVPRRDLFEDGANIRPLLGATLRRLIGSARFNFGVVHRRNFTDGQEPSKHAAGLRREAPIGFSLRNDARTLEPRGPRSPR